MISVFDRLHSGPIIWPTKHVMEKGIVYVELSENPLDNLEGHSRLEAEDAPF
jgi:hypothetical protein